MPTCACAWRAKRAAALIPGPRVLRPHSTALSLSRAKLWQRLHRAQEGATRGLLRKNLKSYLLKIYLHVNCDGYDLCALTRATSSLYHPMQAQGWR